MAAVGADRGIQLDFGGFDQRFLGITVKAASERAFRILGGRVDPLDLAALDPDAAFEQLAIETVTIHEARHFHDFLLSPFGAASFRYRLSAYVNAFNTIVMLGDEDVTGGANTIPIPIPAWCRKDKAERERLIASWDAVAAAQGIGPHLVPPLPLIDDSPELSGRSEARSPDAAFLQRAVEVTSRNYARLRTLVEIPGARMQSYHVSEASALLAQSQAIWAHRGPDETGFFLSALLAQETGAYATPLKVLNGVFGEIDAEYTVDRASTIVTWSLLGSPLVQGVEAGAPVIRFVALCRHLLHDAPAWPEDTAELFAAWDEALGYAPTLETLRGSMDHDETFGPQLERLGPTDEVGSALHLAASIFEMYRQARRQCVERFLADPDTYVRPLTYLEHGALALPAPSTMVVFVDSGITLPAPELEAAGWSVYGGGTHMDGTEIATAITRPPPDELSSPIDQTTALEAFSRLTLSDILFSEFSRDFEEFELDLARAALGRRDNDVRLRNLPA